MRVRVITRPDPVVTWEDAEQHLSLGGDVTQKTQVEAMIAAATANLDGPGGWLGRAIGAQVLEAYADSFGCGEITLPYPEIVGVLSVTYVDANGDDQVIDASDYRLVGDTLIPAYGKSWPSPRSQPEAVRIEYDAGYEEGDPALAVIRAAILLMVGDLYRFRETTVAGTIATAVPMSMTVKNLLDPLRKYD